MKIIVTGATGQVGWELRRSLQPRGEVMAVDRQQLDLGDANALRRLVDEHKPDVVVNAAAYTAVDQAESDQAASQRINADAPAILAQACQGVGALFIHYSTDYVFDGSQSRPYVETDPTAPVNAYGRTKLAGEQGIAAAGGQWLVLRTSWVYSARGRNFLRTMLRLAAERDRLTVVNDQIGAPTSARFLADATAQIVNQAIAQRAQQTFESGVYHLTAGGFTSWHGFAQAIIDQARSRGLPVKCTSVAGIPASQYPTAAARPMNSRLDSSAITKRFGVMPPAWQAGLALVMDELADQV